MVQRGWLGMIGWLLVTGPAWAGSVAIEDHALLAPGAWQMNSIFSLYPNTQSVDGVSVSALGPEESSWLGQFAQEFRYGLTDRLMIRSTVPMSLLRAGTGDVSAGVGDLEVFLKAGLLTDTPVCASVGLQLMVPTGRPEAFSVNGSVNLVPSLMLNAAVGPGDLTASLGYAHALGYRAEGKFVQPSDALCLALGYGLDLGSGWCVACEVLETETLASQVDGLPDATSTGRQLSAGPAVTWSLDASRALSVALQAAVWREGRLPTSQPLFGLVQYSWDF